MALDRCQKLVFAQYLENGWTEFNQILYTLYHWQDLCLYRKRSFFVNLQQSYSPWFMSEIVFSSNHENGWTEFNRILYTHYYWQGLCWYCIFFFIFATDLRPLIDVRNWLVLNILRMDGQNLTIFCIYIFFDKIYVGKIKRHFSQICNGVMVLDWCQKLVFAQYHDNECREFNQILYIYYHWYNLSNISSLNGVVLLNISLSSDSAWRGYGQILWQF